MSVRPGADAPLPSPAFDLEARLGSALVASPTPAEIAAMDRRVSAAMELPRPAGRIHRPRRSWRVVLLAAAALVVFVGAGSSLFSMYQNLGGGGYRVAWDRSVKFGMTQVHDGYQVTLEAAYADAAQTMLAISIQDLKGGRSSQVDLRGGNLTDEAGRSYSMTSGGSTPADSSSSVNTVWFQTPGDGTLSGRHHFSLDVPEIGVREVTPDTSIPPGVLSDGSDVHDPWNMVAGPWRFEFDLTIASGTVLSPAATATANGVTAKVESVLVSPTTVQLKMSYAGLPSTGSAWASIATVRHNGAGLAVIGSRGSGDAAAGEVMTTNSGTDSASGIWVVRIDELVGEGKGGQVRLAGPWVLQFTAP